MRRHWTFIDLIVISSG